MTLQIINYSYAMANITMGGDTQYSDPGSTTELNYPLSYILVDIGEADSRIEYFPENDNWETSGQVRLTEQTRGPDGKWATIAFML